MKKLSLACIIFIVAQIFTVTVAFAGQESDAQNGASDSFVSGTVWVDENQNGIQELSEPGMAEATVYVQNLDTNDIVTATTDIFGNFVASNLVFGRYVVWCEGDEGITNTRVIELNEVTGAATLQFSVPAPEFDLLMSALQIPTFTIFLPVVNN